MNDDLEQRLYRLRNQPTTALDAATLAAMEARVMSAAVPRRRVLMPILATAAALLLLAGAVFAFRDDRRDSLQPGDTAPFATITASTVTVSVTSTTVVSGPATTTPGTSTPSTAITVPTSASSPGATVVPATAAPTGSSTVSATTPAPTPTTTPATPSSPSASTTPTTVAPTPPQPMPAASFTLNVRRVDGQLRFNWPRYEGPGGERYVLVRVGPGGLTEWPPATVRVAATVNRIGVTFISLDLPGTEPRRWVLAVVGADRELLAVSSPVTSS